MKLGILTAGLVGALVFTVDAKVVPASPFCDGAVLQRDRKVPVWGKADSGETVTVRFGGAEVRTTAGADGRWRVDLPPMAASKTPRTLEINDIRVKDVLVGEVWLASGQSNMALLIHNGGDPRVRDRNGAAVAQIVRHDDVRYANLLDWQTSATPQDAIAFKWRRHCPEETTRGWDGGQSAVCFYFSELIRQALDVPVGVIVAAAGGTRLPPFAPADAWEASGLDPKLWKTAQPGVVWNHYFAPVAPYAVRGLLWYQGETDNGYAKSGEYVKMLGVFHRAWSKAFGGELPFYLAQICSGGAIARDQALYARETPSAHCAIISDVGNPWDIHPSEKFTVGLRLAMLALRYEYGWNDVRADSPFPRSARAEGAGKVRVSFDHARAFYTYAMDYTAQTPFQLAGANGKWYDAKLENQVDVRRDRKTGRETCAGHVRGVQLVLSSTNVPMPKLVRYTGDACLAAVYNDAALPVSPFEMAVVGDGKGTATESAAVAMPSFLSRVRILGEAKATDVVKRVAGLKEPIPAPSAAELADAKFVRLKLTDVATGKGLSEEAFKVASDDFMTRIVPQKLSGVILDATGIDNPDEPVLYYAAGWVQNCAEDGWGL